MLGSVIGGGNSMRKLVLKKYDLGEIGFERKTERGGGEMQEKT